MRALQESLMLYSLLTQGLCFSHLNHYMYTVTIYFLRLHITHMKEMYMKKYMRSCSGTHKMPSHVHEMSDCAIAYSSSW